MLSMRQVAFVAFVLLECLRWGEMGPVARVQLRCRIHFTFPHYFSERYSFHDLAGIPVFCISANAITNPSASWRLVMSGIFMSIAFRLTRKPSCEGFSARDCMVMMRSSSVG